MAAAAKGKTEATPEGDAPAAVRVFYDQQGFLDHVEVDGEGGYKLDELTFREQREVRGLIRELTGDGGMEVVEAANMDFIPAIVTVVRRRGDANYSLDQALEEHAEIVEPTPPTDDELAQARATRGARGAP